MKKLSTLILPIILSCQSLLAPEQARPNAPLFTPKECCILAAWLAAGISVETYEYYQTLRSEPPVKPPMTKKMD